MNAEEKEEALSGNQEFNHKTILVFPASPSTTFPKTQNPGQEAPSAH